MIDAVTGWFKIAQYEDKRAISIANLVETMWLSRYPRPKKSHMTKERNLLVTSS